MSANDTFVTDNAWVGGHATIRDRAVVEDHAQVCGNVHVAGRGVATGYACIDGDKVVRDVTVTPVRCIPQLRVYFLTGGT